MFITFSSLIGDQGLLMKFDDQEKITIDVYAAKHANMALQLPIVAIHSQQSLCPLAYHERVLAFLHRPSNCGILRSQP